MFKIYVLSLALCALVVSAQNRSSGQQGDLSQFNDQQQQQQQLRGHPPPNYQGPWMNNQFGSTGPPPCRQEQRDLSRQNDQQREQNQRGQQQGFDGMQQDPAGNYGQFGQQQQQEKRQERGQRRAGAPRQQQRNQDIDFNGQF